MDPSALLTEAFDRVGEGVLRVLADLDADGAAAPVLPGANTVAWLVWHLARIQDAQVADAFGHEQVWTADHWHGRLGLAFEPDATGYGFTPAEVAAVRADPELLAEYAAAVLARTRQVLLLLPADALDRIVDDGYDPPVTLGARLVSVLADDLQHLGQAAFVRGLPPV